MPKKKVVDRGEDLVEKYKRPALENVLKRRFFVIPAFEIYNNGVAGLYDYGPTGCALKNNIEAYWREHFILEESMLEITGTCLTPEVVLKASGHVERFTDYAVRDLKTGTCYRADKLIQEYIDKQKKKKNVKQIEIDELNILYNQADRMTEEDLDKTIQGYKIKSPDTGNDLSYPFKFNLMFETQIGPTGGLKGFLRPETAQGHFVNFRRLLEFNGGKVPFASASIGLGFRNEISPRSGLLRVREFTMAEIEHFVDPYDKSHKKFHTIKHLKLPLWSAESQEQHKGLVNDLTLEEAVQTKLIDNETLAYFIARTYLFLTTIGIRKEGVRFRQHAKDEMAHYASDCWDAEIETSYGWVEVAGHADRTCYDLTNHTKFSGVELVASRPLKQPLTKTLTRLSMNKGNIYKIFKELNRSIVEKLESLTETEKDDLFQQLQKNGDHIELTVKDQQVKLTKDFVSLEKYEHTQIEEKFVPGVIEPSFGIGRIVYCVLEHAFGVREKDAKRTYFAFPPVVAPYKVSIIPLIHDEQMLRFIEPISKLILRRYHFLNIIFFLILFFLRKNPCSERYQSQN